MIGIWERSFKLFGPDFRRKASFLQTRVSCVSFKMPSDSKNHFCFTLAEEFHKLKHTIRGLVN